MTIKADPGGPVAIEAAVSEIDTVSAEEIKLAAETYRERKFSAPEVTAASIAAQLHSAAGDLAYYRKLVDERAQLVKELASQLDARDVDVAAILALVNKP